MKFLEFVLVRYFYVLANLLPLDGGGAIVVHADNVIVGQEPLDLPKFIVGMVAVFQAIVPYEVKLSMNFIMKSFYPIHTVTLYKSDVFIQPAQRQLMPAYLDMVRVIVQTVEQAVGGLDQMLHDVKSRKIGEVLRYEYMRAPSL